MHAEVETLNAELLRRYPDLSRKEYPEGVATDLDHLAWKNLDNPQGPSMAVHLYDDGEVVGRIVCQVRLFHSAGSALRGGYLVDLLIAPSHRGLANFAKLMSPLASPDFADFLYVTPNDRSMPLYRRYLRWTEPFQLDVYGWPTKPFALLGKQFARSLGMSRKSADDIPRDIVLGWNSAQSDDSGLTFSAECPVESEHEALVRRVGADYKLIGDRSLKFLEWRFAKSPVWKYTTNFIYRSRQYRGYVVTRAARYRGYSVLFLADHLLDGELTVDECRAIRHWLLARASESCCELIITLANAGGAVRRGLLGFPLVRIPRRLVPRETPLFVHSRMQGFEVEPAATYVTPADLDVF